MTAPGMSWTGALRSRNARVGLALLVGITVLAMIAPWLGRHAPDAYAGPPNQPPDLDFWFGTTAEGKDVFSQTLIGARVSLLVGFATGIGVMTLGFLVGALAGYLGGWVDEVLSLAANVFLVLPGLPLAVVVAAYLPPGPVTLCCVLVLTGWAWNARVLRAATLALREKEFVVAAVAIGEARWRILRYEILPHLSSLLMSGFIGATLHAIAAQVGLEFLGLGDASLVTWGTNLYWAANNGAVLTGAWWTIVPTGVCVATVGLALALMNSAVDEFANPRLITPGRWREALSPAQSSAQGVTPVLRSD